HTLLQRDPDVDDQEVQDELLGPELRWIAALQALAQSLEAVAREPEDPLQGARDRDLAVLALGLGRVDVFEGRNLQGRAVDRKRRPELAGKIKGLRTGDRIVDVLEVLVGAVRAADGFLRSALDVAPQQ